MNILSGVFGLVLGAFLFMCFIERRAIFARVAFWRGTRNIDEYRVVRRVVFLPKTLNIVERRPDISNDDRWWFKSSDQTRSMTRCRIVQRWMKVDSVWEAYGWRDFGWADD